MRTAIETVAQNGHRHHQLHSFVHVKRCRLAAVAPAADIQDDLIVIHACGDERIPVLLIQLCPAKRLHLRGFPDGIMKLSQYKHK